MSATLYIPGAWSITTVGTGFDLIDAANNGTPQTPQKTPCAVPSGNHLSMGASVQWAAVNLFNSGGGGVWGANQIKSSGFDHV